MLKRAYVIPFTILCLAIGIFLAISSRWTSWIGGSSVEVTDDAYVHADVTPLSTRISGTVRTLQVNDYQPVHQGQLLVQLDDEDYEAALKEAQAALAGAEAELAANQADKRVQDSRVQEAETGVDQAMAAVSAAEAEVAAVQPKYQQAALESKRQQALLAAKATTREQEEQAVAGEGQSAGSLANSQAILKRAHAALAGEQSMLLTAQNQRAALDTKDRVYQATIAARRAAIVVAEVNLNYTRIMAPIDGAVGERHVQVGQLVAPGMPVVDLVEGDVWIAANYKETQLTHIRSGDAVDIRIDAFPGVMLHGKVSEISPASGSQFALLPPDNATGNFTKVVQRIPVKIVLDQNHALHGMLRPGFSAVVSIHPSAGAAGAGDSLP